MTWLELVRGGVELVELEDPQVQACNDQVDLELRVIQESSGREILVAFVQWLEVMSTWD